MTDAVQQKMMMNMLKQLLRTKVSSIYEDPIIKVEINGPLGNPIWVFVFNPFYKGPDPLNRLFLEINNEGERKVFVRNPFAPGAGYGYDMTTAEKIIYSNYNRGNIDPF